MAPFAQAKLSTQVWQSDAELPLLLERYQLLGIIGEGGMGTVFKGYHVNLKRHVAIKTLRINHRTSDELVNRFLKEMESVGQMDHPNVVRATDAGEKNGVFYLVMEFLTGSDFAHLVARRGRLDVFNACELTRQAALGLDYIHQTLIHRDIKPSNLMLTSGGQVKVLDLGLARFGYGEGDDQDLTPDGFAVGTYAYMAPEQATVGSTIDHRADLYSLGCTLFTLLTGNAPYKPPVYDSVAKVINAHCHVPLTKIETFHTIPEALQSVLLRMMAKERDQRYRSGREVAEALAPFIVDHLSAHSLLVERAEEESDAVPLKPLPRPLPEEISRLTDPISSSHTLQETPREASTLAIALPVQQPVQRPWRRWLPLSLVFGVAAVSLAAFLGYHALMPVRLPIEEPPVVHPGVVPLPITPAARQGVRDLDALTPHQYHVLLDQRPIVLGGDLENSRQCRWDQKQEILDVLGSSHLLFLLGKTRRTLFSVEVGINQSPWTGCVGVFWGYREDEEIKKSKVPLQYFAWFQMLEIEHNVGKKGEDLYYVSRVKGSLRYNKVGEIAPNLYTHCRHPLRLTNGEAILHLEIDGDRLRFARLGAFELTELYSNETNQHFATEPGQGVLGLISLKHTAAFRHARFILQSNQ